MGNKITTIVTTFIILIIFIFLIAFISTDTQIDEATQAVQEFTETVRYNGYITYDQYANLINKIPYKNMKVQITHFIADTDASYSPGTLNMRFTSQILGTANDSYGSDVYDSSKGFKMRFNGDTDLYSGTLLNTSGNASENGIYKMQVGDSIQVDLVIMEDTFFDTIVSVITRQGTPSIKILTSASGVILNEKYNKVA